MFVVSEGGGGGGSRNRDCEPDEGCAFPLETGPAHKTCGAPCRAGSVYCAEHHALCHVQSGSAAERRRLRETEALAAAVGGRRGPIAMRPSERSLRRLERAARGHLLRPNRSRIVPRTDEAAQ